MAIYDETYMDGSLAGDLSGDTLSGEFYTIDFRGSNLQKAILCGTFVGCDFSGADLRGAQLSFEQSGNTFTGAIMPNGRRQP